MKMKQDDVGRVAAAAREAGEDLFCIVGVTPGFDALTSLYILPEEPTLLLLPGTFAAPDRLIREDHTPAFARTGFPSRQVYTITDGVLAADVCLLGDEAFRSFCENRGIRHLLVPFAELADGTEYGFRAAYGWIAEWRASLPCDLRVTALFSAPPEDFAAFVRLFGSPGCTVIDASVPPVLYAWETADVRKKYAYTFSLAQRFATKRTAVLFTDRREAEEFLRLPQKQGTAAMYLNGSLPPERHKMALEAFADRGGLLVATKSALPSLLFYRADRVVFCGVPYSRAFLTRCASFSAEHALECCFCPKDIETDINILKCFAGNRPEEERESFLSGSLQKLLAVKQQLAEPE